MYCKAEYLIKQSDKYRAESEEKGMKIKDYKCKCGENDFFFDDKGNQKGIYCSYCGRWLKWANKDEQNLEMRQEHILDKIKAEIEQLPITDTAVRLVTEILDKYKVESETEE